MSNRNCILVGISGVSSSGKTTLSRLLCEIFPHSFILHGDDFYLPDDQIPMNCYGDADWDCIESLDVERLYKVLEHVKSHGAVPEWHKSIQGGNAVAKVEVGQDEIDALKEKQRRNGSQGTPMCIMDGFLLFSENMKRVRDLFDVKILLRAKFEIAKARREARSGYVTYESFWEDPPNYVEQCVWPNYVKDHAFLFKNGDVEGELDHGVCSRLGIRAMPLEDQQDMTKSLKWAYGILDKAVQPQSGGAPKGNEKSNSIRT